MEGVRACARASRAKKVMRNAIEGNHLNCFVLERRDFVIIREDLRQHFTVSFTREFSRR